MKNITDLVTRAFAKPKRSSPEKPARNRRVDDSQARQPAANGEDGSQFVSMAPPGLLSHLLRVFGLDGGKLGAMAINGIIMIAQMVSDGMVALGLYMQQNFWDWGLILEYIVRRVRESQRGPTVQTAGVGEGV